MGLALDMAAAKALVAQVGERQQRLLRELEKLALEGDPGNVGSSSGPSSGPRQISAQDIEARAAHSAEWRAYGLADALVGADGREATLSYLRLREQGERLSGLIYLMAQRLRDALAISLRLQDGDSVADVKRTLRMPARAAERFVADVARTDPDKLRAALATMADLELNSRGGAPLLASRTSFAGLSEDTLAQRAIEKIAG
jgi:DNA polymerase-3 subunit delta